MSQKFKGCESVLNIENIVRKINPLDDTEVHHIHETLSWIQSGAPIFRLQKPDIPNKHLVSYFVPFDKKANKILLTVHKKSGLWLPPGGHVELNEDPRETVRRECLEELGCTAEFWRTEPLFLTSTLTVGPTAGHTDVSFWYVIQGHQEYAYQFNLDEFEAIRWFGFNEIPYENSDPHMGRFLKKLVIEL
ncbi:NUDIX hydrolase [Candidatus Paracaedimonas acanthamoebae]|nr:NUDIX hydrolase [Candidatus Paracaedimonas acanthamoebae]